MISIVTPSFNQGMFLEQTILSVINQNYKNYEYVIIDGGSADNSIEIIKKYDPFITYWVSESDEGQSNAINKGLQLCKGDILAYICSDDLYVAGAFQFAASFFVQHTDVDMIYGGCHFIDEKGKVLRNKRVVPFSRKKLLCHNIIWQPTVFFHRRVWEKIGFFNETLRDAQDYDYWLRASETFKIVGIDRYLACYRWHSESKTVKTEAAQLLQGYRNAQQYGGGGFWSWVLHRIYWPSTGGIKRKLYKVFNLLKTAEKYNKL
jgi:glycosyltransferase involved in cell wall biosynthesis